MRKSNFLLALMCTGSLMAFGSVALGQDSFYNQGTKLLMAGQFKAALPYFDASIGKGTKFIAAYINRGVCYSSLGYFQKALDDYNSALKIDPNDHTALVNRGGVYAKMAKYELGIKDLDKVADQEYKSKSKSLAGTYFKRAVMYHQCHKYQQCADDCRRVIAIASAPPSMRQNADSLIKWCSVEEVVYDLAKVAQFIKSKDLVNADKTLEKISKGNPAAVLPKKNLAQFHALQAAISFERKDFDKAGKAAEEAVKLDFNNGVSHAILGKVYLKERKFQEAGEEFSRAISAKERSIEIYCGRAIVRLIQQRPDQALNDLNDALVLDAKDSHVLTLRAIAALSKKSYNPLIAAGQDVIEKEGFATDKGAAAALMSYDGFLLSEKKEEASKLVDTGLEKSPAKDKWSNQLFQFMKKQINEDALLTASQTATQKTDAHACIGVMAVRAGDKAAAQKAFEWCKTNADPSQTSWLLLASELYDPQSTAGTAESTTSALPDAPATPVEEKSNTPTLPPELQGLQPEAIAK